MKPAEVTSADPAARAAGGVDVTVVITTRDRPELLRRAIDSAMAQTHPSLEVLVVDDGSIEPVELPQYARARVIRHPHSRGSAAARNTGLEAAHGRWVTFLDDDDRLLPDMVEVSLEALAETALPPPVGVLSGVEAVDTRGKVLETKLPPTCLRGTWFGVEAIPGYPPGPAYQTKQTLLIERGILLAVGGWNAEFQPRETTELFLRLSQTCSFLGLPYVTYRHLHHEGPRLTGDPLLRERGLKRLVREHRAVFQAHPEGYADYLRRHAHYMRLAGLWRKALVALAHAFWLAPASTLQETVASVRREATALSRRRFRRGASTRPADASERLRFPR